MVRMFISFRLALPILCACTLILGSRPHLAQADIGADPAPRRAAFKQALELAETRPLDQLSTITQAQADHPLAVYLDYVVLQRQLDRLQAPTIAAFIEKNPSIPIAETLRTQALFALAKRQDWSGFQQLYKGSTNAALRCLDLISRQATPPSPDWLEAALDLWLSGNSQPRQCDAVFDTLRRNGQFTPVRLLQRIDLAAAAHNPGLMRYLARSLPASQTGLIESYAAFLTTPTVASTAQWPKDARSRDVIVQGLKQLARNDPDQAETLLSALGENFQLDADQRGQILNSIALWSAASYLSESTARFARVPAAAWDARLHTWQVREALARGDDDAALAAIEAMPTTQREELRWRYFEARLRERTGQADVRSRYQALAGESSYYGFLAAERIHAPYALCALDVAEDANLRHQVQTQPGLVRALELQALGRSTWARREWTALMPQLSPEQRRMAVSLAEAAGWHDRGPSTLREGEDLRYYLLRFPFPHRDQIEREATRYTLDPAWVAALIRAESAWAPDARSHANARGLMQLLPSTAQLEAKKRSLTYPGTPALFDPAINIDLGIAHLASMLEKHDDQTLLATAAYNAGATPVGRWLAQRPIQDVDLWIETIPYHETREYVARILAFGVIYDWRLHGTASPITARARGRTVPDSERLGFSCPAVGSEASS